MTTTPQLTDELTHLTPGELWELAEAYFVYDPDDASESGRLARTVGRFHGVVCVEIPPGEPRPLGALALAILQRLGKDLDREKQINQRDAWRLARVWLDAELIQALIIIGADQLEASTWKELVDVCRQMPTPSVILIQHQTGRDDAQRELLNSERAFTSVPPATFHEWGGRFIAACEHAATAGSDDERREKRRFPAVPDDEIPYFRAACRDALSTPDFRVVDDAYRKSFDSTFRWLQGRQNLDEDQAGAFLAEQLSWRRDVNEQLTRLRGAQVAFLRHWWLLKVDVEALVAAYHVDAPLDIDDDVYERLRAYVQPKTSALAALAIATKLPPGRLAMLNADQVYAGLAWHRSSGYDTVDLGDQVLPVSGASLFLRAHHLDRAMRDQPTDGPLFTTSTGQRLTAAGIQQQLRRITRDVALPLVAGWSPRTSQQHSHWMHRRGLTLQPL